MWNFNRENHGNWWNSDGLHLDYRSKAPWKGLWLRWPIHLYFAKTWSYFGSWKKWIMNHFRSTNLYICIYISFSLSLYIYTQFFFFFNGTWNLPDPNIIIYIHIYIYICICNTYIICTLHDFFSQASRGIHPNLAPLFNVRVGRPSRAGLERAGYGTEALEETAMERSLCLEDVFFF